MSHFNLKIIFCSILLLFLLMTFNCKVSGSPSPGDAEDTPGYFDSSGTDVPCYWTNAMLPNELPGNDGQARDIKVVSGTVYTAGYYVNGSNVACYWVGTNKTDLSGAQANEIFVVE